MYKRSLDFKFWDARFYLDKDGNLRNKIRRGVGKRQQKGAIATTNSHGYLIVKEHIDGKQVNIFAHRLAWLLYTGEDPGDRDINHKNQNRKDNRLKNLEVLPHKDHMRKHPKRSDCSSGVTGVCWDKGNQKWMAHIGTSKNQRIIKRFTDFFEACCYRKSLENKLGYFPEHGMTKEEVKKYFEEEAENA